MLLSIGVVMEDNFKKNILIVTLIAMCVLKGHISAVSLGTSVRANAIAVRSGDGKIVAAGTAVIAGVNNFVVAQYDKDGTLDTTFNTDGVATILIGTCGQANALAI